MGRGRTKKGRGTATDRLADAVAGLKDDAEAIKDMPEGAAADSLPDVVNRVSQAVTTIEKKWREMPALFDGDPEVMLRLRNSAQRIMTIMMDVVEETVAIIHQRLLDQKDKGDEEQWSLHDLLRVTEAMNNQIATMRGRDPKPATGGTPAEHRTVDELQAVIDEKRRKLGRRFLPGAEASV